MTAVVIEYARVSTEDQNLDLQRGVELRSLTEGIDAAAINGKSAFHLFAALPEFERALIRERTQAGLAADRDRHKKGKREPDRG